MLKNLKNFSKNSILFLEKIAQLVRVLACHVNAGSSPVFLEKLIKI